MLFASPILLLAAILPAVVVADGVYSGIVVPQAGSASKRDVSPLLRRYTPGQACDAGADLSCCFPGTTEYKKPSTCPIPLTNDPKLPGVDTILRDGYGLCDNGRCTCSMSGMTYPQILIICTDLVSRLDPTQKVIDACYNGDDLHCSSVGSSVPSFPGTDITTREGRYCYNGVYKEPSGGN